MFLTYPDAFHQWTNDYPIVWWTPEARRTVGRIPLGEPGWETDPGHTPTGPDDQDGHTGNRVNYDPTFDVWDRAILDVSIAGWQYATSLPGDQGPELAAYQYELDRAALDGLIAQVEAGDIDIPAMIDVIKGEVRRQATALGVDITYVDTVPDEPEP